MYQYIKHKLKICFSNLKVIRDLLIPYGYNTNNIKN